MIDSFLASTSEKKTFLRHSTAISVKVFFNNLPHQTSLENRLHFICPRIIKDKFNVVIIRKPINLPI